MINITFLPYSDEYDYSQAIKEYQDIWNLYGSKICELYEAFTGFSFAEKNMNGLVWAGISHAPPLCLRYNLDLERKKTTLVHELGHCLFNKKIKNAKGNLTSHHFLFLVLFDVFVELFGEKAALEAVEWDKNLPNPEYRAAWEFAFSFSTKEERHKKFAEMLKTP